MNVGNIVGIISGIKLANGKFKPKYGVGSIIGLVTMILFFIGFFCLFIFGLIKMNLELIVVPAGSMFALGYILLINPYTQKSSNYYIEFQNENTLDGFKLSYKDKGKLVNILYKIDDNGRIAFANNSSKLSCISYADGTKMSNLVKYKIINYFIKWLSDNNLLSSEVTHTFEQ